MSVTEVTLVFPHQLFENHPALSQSRKVLLVEDPHFFTRFSFHKIKVLFHKETLSAYKKFLTEQGFDVDYLTFTDDVFGYFQTKKIKALHCAAFHDHLLLEKYQQYCTRLEIDLIIYESPYFLTSTQRFHDYFSHKSSYHMSHFYREQRIYFNILMDGKQPKGGKYSYDSENRKKLPSTLTLPRLPKVHALHNKKEAHDFIELNFPHNPGSIDQFFYPTTFESAKAWFDNFLEKRLRLFGPYEDALDRTNPFLFHSIVSPLLNCGLLTPDYIVQRTLAYVQESSVPLNSLEGFMRQIIGWREFMYGIYLYNNTALTNSNFFENKNNLPRTFLEGTTGIVPVDETVEQVTNIAYAHHIQRLMVVGNFLLLCETNPSHVYKWFTEFFIDAYDWVMVPNVYGMSQFANGPLMTTKPYIASSHYIRQMSNYPGGKWTEIVDALYWRFLVQHQERLRTIPRMNLMLNVLHKKDKPQLTSQMQRASHFLSQLHKDSAW